MLITKICLRLCTSLILTALFCSASIADAENDTKSNKSLLDQQPEIINVPFATLRDKTGSKDFADYFGGMRDELRTGTCSVSFSPIWGLGEIADSAPFYIPDEKIKLTGLQETDPDNYFDELESFIQKNNGNIVIYIHGYNIDFDKSCRRSAIFQRSLGLQDRLLLFSWPSEGNLLKYTWDEADLVWSVPYMADFIEQVVKRAGTGKVDIVAHSLGARGTIQALVRLAYKEQQESIVNELILIAPDIDTEIFKQELPLINKSANRITLYLSKNDKALKLSQEVHGYPRLGQAGEHMTVIDGVETIDISNVNTRVLSGHIYHLFNPQVIDDLTQLLNTGKPASQRPTLESASKNGISYWRLITKEK